MLGPRCISDDGSSQDGPKTCQTLATLDTPNGISISANQRFIYVTDYATNSRVHILSRNPTTGALSEVHCLAETAITGCSAGRDLGDARTLVLSPDGKHAYSADYEHDGVSISTATPAQAC